MGDLAGEAGRHATGGPGRRGQDAALAAALPALSPEEEDDEELLLLSEPELDPLSPPEPLSPEDRLAPLPRLSVL